MKKKSKARSVSRRKEKHACFFGFCIHKEPGFLIPLVLLIVVCYLAIFVLWPR